MSDQNSVQSLMGVLFGSPLNTILTLLIGYLLYRIVKLRHRSNKDESEANSLKLPDPLPKHDMTLEELRKYDGKGSDKRICVAILGNVYDCTKGYRFYGPGGPYGSLAGHDATRALALFDVGAVKEEWDDVSDLTPFQISSVNEWSEQFSERYDLVGKLVKDVNEIADEDNKDDKCNDDKTQEQ